MIAIVKYETGNIRSVANALERLGYDYVVTNKSSELEQADKVILPGVGAAAVAMSSLRETKTDEVILHLKQPVLGICLGMQLMCRYSEEGNVKCMDIFNTTVRKLPPIDRVPHMGWNNLINRQGPIFANMNVTDDVYFVHSYAADICESTIAVCDYIQPFSAALNKQNFYATQFHPEKSAAVGNQLLKNFLSL